MLGVSGNVRFRQFENCFDLVFRNGGEIGKKLLHRVVPFKMVVQRCDGNACTREAGHASLNLGIDRYGVHAPDFSNSIAEGYQGIVGFQGRSADNVVTSLRSSARQYNAAVKRRSASSFQSGAAVVLVPHSGQRSGVARRS